MPVGRRRNLLYPWATQWGAAAMQGPSPCLADPTLWVFLCSRHRQSSLVVSGLPRETQSSSSRRRMSFSSWFLPGDTQSRTQKMLVVKRLNRGKGLLLPSPCSPTPAAQTPELPSLIGNRRGAGQTVCCLLGSGRKRRQDCFLDNISEPVHLPRSLRGSL